MNPDPDPYGMSGLQLGGAGSGAVRNIYGFAKQAYNVYRYSCRRSTIIKFLM
jgi:hypothetical protein